MEVAREWKDYEILATGDGEKIERWKKRYAASSGPAGYLACGNAAYVGKKAGRALHTFVYGRRQVGV